MESMGGISEREWISLSEAYTAEESDFTASLLNNYSFPNELNAGLSLEIPTAYWPAGNESALNMAAVDEGSYYSSETSDSNMYGFSQGNNYIVGSTLFPNSAKQNYNLSDSHPLLLSSGGSLSLDFCMEDVRHANAYHIQEDNGLNQKRRQSKVQQSPAEPAAVIEKNLQRKKKAQVTADEPNREEKNALIENPKKRSLNSPDVEKTKRSVRARKNQKLAPTSHNEEDNIVSPNGQCTSSFCSEDDSNEPHELNGGVTSSSSSKGSGTLNSNGKPRASRGSATDPQSLYARKRRERINERLRILQNLVPNGTKVDISTMLEEAVQFVKFLQLQIKLLSSDDLWMYAPIAYNGIDIGLNLKLMKQDNLSQ